FLRKYIAIIMLTTVIGGALTIFLLMQSGFAVIINNETDVEISNIEITYENIKTNIEVPPIAAGDDAILEIDPETQATEEFDETNIELSYIDKQGETHTEIIFGYYEKGYTGDAKVTITDIDEDGILSLEVEEYVGYN